MKGVRSSQVDFAIHGTGFGGPVVSQNLPFVFVYKKKRNKEGKRAACLVQIRNDAGPVAANYVMWSSVCFPRMDKTGDIFPMLRESAAVVYIVEAEECLDLVGSSTPVCFGIRSKGFIFKEAVSHTFVRESSRLSILLDFPRSSFVSSTLWFSFSCEDSSIGHYVVFHEIASVVSTLSWRWHHQGIVFQYTIYLENLMVIWNVSEVFTMNHHSWKLAESFIMVRCGGGHLREAASWIFSRVGFRHMWYTSSVHF